MGTAGPAARPQGRERLAGAQQAGAGWPGLPGGTREPRRRTGQACRVQEGAGPGWLGTGAAPGATRGAVRSLGLEVLCN